MFNNDDNGEPIAKVSACDLERRLASTEYWSCRASRPQYNIVVYYSIVYTIHSEGKMRRSKASFVSRTSPP